MFTNADRTLNVYENKATQNIMTDKKSETVCDICELTPFCDDNLAWIASLFAAFPQKLATEN